MGGDIRIENPRLSGAEPVADLRVHRSALTGRAMSPRRWCRSRSMNFRCSSSPQPAPQGETVVSGAEELRVKESDRIAAMSAGLSTLGREAQRHARRHAHRRAGRGPGFRRRRGRQPRRSSGGDVLQHGEPARRPAHRDSGRGNVATSFPGFVGLARSIGLNLDGVRPHDRGARAHHRRAVRIRQRHGESRRRQGPRVAFAR